jgi:hypothetical protein
MLAGRDLAADEPAADEPAAENEDLARCPDAAAQSVGVLASAQVGDMVA